MTDDLAVAFLSSPHQWVGRWQRHLHDHGPGQVADVIAEARLAFEKPWRVLLAAADHQLLTEAFVAKVHAERRGIVAVYDPADPRAKQRALDAEVDALIEQDATPAELARVLADVATRRPQRNPASRRRPVATPTQARRGGPVIAVGGPEGSERAVVAMTLASTLGATVVEVDEVSPSLAQRTGAGTLPNLASACAALGNGGSVADHVVEASGLSIVAGLADPGQWADVSPTAVASTVTSLASGGGRVVALLGPSLEALGRVDRYGSSRAVASRASAVIAVGVASPSGLAALTHYVAGVRSLTSAPLWLVTTGMGRARSRRAEVEAALWRLGDLPAVGAAGVSVLSLDARRAERAAWDGGVIGRGAFALALRRLGREACG